MEVSGIISTTSQKYLPVGPVSDTDYPEYTGNEQPIPDSPITAEEMRFAAHNLKRKTPPGPDGVTNSMLKNLDDKSFEWLTLIFNRVWDAGEAPTEWKTAKVVLIPKPGKPPKLRT